MKRDINLIKRLLESIEAKEVGDAYYTIDQEECYHLQLMNDAGLIEGSVFHDLDGSIFANIDRLTNRGHDMLEKSRDDKWWKKVAKVIADKGFESVVSALTSHGVTAVTELF